MKNIIYLVVCLAISGCDDQNLTDNKSDFILSGDTSTINIYYSGCNTDQPNPHPNTCDYYDDGSKCCIWKSDDFHEEWCQNSGEMCWEINGAWEE